MENTLQVFIKLVESPCLPCLSVEDDFVWGKDLVNSQFISSVLPIFSLQLKMDENGAYYNTPPESFAVISVFKFNYTFCNGS